jgi:hypothetical protein
VPDEARALARVEPQLSRAPLVEQLEAERPELAVQLLDELQLLPLRYARNWASSVEPFSASVDASGDTACVTRSK